VPEREGNLFHAPWEPRVLALSLAKGATGRWNFDMSRARRNITRAALMRIGQQLAVGPDRVS